MLSAGFEAIRVFFSVPCFILVFCEYGLLSSPVCPYKGFLVGFLKSIILETAMFTKFIHPAGAPEFK